MSERSTPSFRVPKKYKGLSKRSPEAPRSF